MSDYQQNSPTFALPRELVQLIIQRDQLYAAYIDVFALIHDLLCEFTDSLEKPRFTPAEINEQENRVVRKFYTRALGGVPEALVRNVEENFGLAKEIRSRAEHGETPYERSQGELRATQFLNSVVQTYTTLRILKQYAEPVQTSSHSI